MDDFVVPSFSLFLKNKNIAENVTLGWDFRIVSNRVVLTFLIIFLAYILVFFFGCKSLYLSYLLITWISVTKVEIRLMDIYFYIDCNRLHELYLNNNEWRIFKWFFC